MTRARRDEILIAGGAVAICLLLWWLSRGAGAGAGSSPAPVLNVAATPAASYTDPPLTIPGYDVPGLSRGSLPALAGVTPPQYTPPQYTPANMTSGAAQCTCAGVGLDTLYYGSPEAHAAALAPGMLSAGLADVLAGGATGGAVIGSPVTPAPVSAAVAPVPVSAVIAPSPAAPPGIGNTVVAVIKGAAQSAASWITHYTPGEIVPPLADASYGGGQLDYGSSGKQGIPWI